ncbi:hypothetical protein IAR50_002472 [Cryptococcus sp. DSM 104548]
MPVYMMINGSVHSSINGKPALSSSLVIIISTRYSINLFFQTAIQITESDQSQWGTQPPPTLLEEYYDFKNDEDWLQDASADLDPTAANASAYEESHLAVPDGYNNMSALVYSPSSAAAGSSHHNFFSETASQMSPTDVEHPAVDDETREGDSIEVAEGADQRRRGSSSSKQMNSAVSDRRREQNRVAQSKYRSKNKQAVHVLEQENTQLTHDISEVRAQLSQVTQERDMAWAENHTLRQTLSTLSGTQSVIPYDEDEDAEGEEVDEN